ncbi:MAG: pentapeptide repeat-containing protein [Pseudomonadota bacterium]
MKETQNWYVRRGKEVKGPFPAGLVSRYILLERISEKDEVSRDRQEWLRVAAVPELIPDVVRNARAHPDDEEAQQHLAAARRWADERREVKGTPPGAERRSAGSMVFSHPSGGADERPGTLINRRDYLIVAVILVGLVAIPFLLPSGPKPSDPQCAAAPAPGINWSNCRLEGRQYPNADLAGANLRNSNLTGTVLRAANLAGADIAYANLTLTNLRGANLKGANLKGATLRNTDLDNVSLENADLSYADLSAVDLDTVNLAGAKLDHAVWRGGVVCMPGSVGECVPAKVQ